MSAEELFPFDKEWVVRVVLCDPDVPAVSEGAVLGLTQVGLRYVGQNVASTHPPT